MEAGIKIEEFWRLSWREFLLYRKGYEARVLTQWQQTRLIGFMMYSNIVKYEKTGRKSMKEWLPLPGDEKEEDTRGPKLSQEEFIASQKLLAEALKGKKWSRPSK